MNTQATTEIRPNQATNLFKHRLETQDLASTAGITDSIMGMTERAKGVLYMLSFHFNEDESDRASDAIIDATIRSAIADIDDIYETIKAHHAAVHARGETLPESKPFATQQRKISLDDVLAMQAIERGIEPMPLEADLLIQRIEQGGDSGVFLSDAFRSSYRKIPFDHGLGEVTNLDAEAFRLFHECIHIRHVEGWSDEALYQIEKRVIAAMEKWGGAE